MTRKTTAEIEEITCDDISPLSSINNQRHAIAANKLEKERGKKRVSKIEHQRLGCIRDLDRREFEMRKTLQTLREQKLAPSSPREISVSLDELDSKVQASESMYLKAKSETDNNWERTSSCPDLRLRKVSSPMWQLPPSSTEEIFRSTEVTRASLTDNLLHRRQLKTSSQQTVYKLQTKDSRGRELLPSHLSGTGLKFHGHFRTKSTPLITIQSESRSDTPDELCVPNDKLRFKDLVNKQMHMHTDKSITLKKALRCFGKSVPLSSGNMNTLTTHKDPPIILPPVYQQSTRKLVKRDFKKAPDIIITDVDWEDVRSCRYVRCDTL